MLSTKTETQQSESINLLSRKYDLGGCTLGASVLKTIPGNSDPPLINAFHVDRLKRKTEMGELRSFQLHQRHLLADRWLLNADLRVQKTPKRGQHFFQFN